METRKVVIVGSGPAGHTAAIYTGRAGLTPLMFEGSYEAAVLPGGQLTTTTEIENFPGFPGGINGFDITQKFREQAVLCGTEIVTEDVVEVNLSARPFVITSESRQVAAETLIIATGATAKRMGVDGEKEYWQKGVSACAVCDGALPLFKNKVLMVIGGGDTACEEALFLTKFASKVIMMLRRDVMRASKVMQARVEKNEKIEVYWNSQLISLYGENNLLSGAVINRNGSEEKVAIGGLFYAIGHQPNVAFLKGQLKSDETGYLLTEAGSTVTNVAGVFAAGDVQDKKWRQAITAAGSGCMAALEAERFLEAHE